MDPPYTKEEQMKEEQNIYSMKDWKCDDCNCVIKRGSKTNHLKSEKHLRNINDDSIKSQLRSQTWECTVCDIVICTRNMSNHLQSQRHLRNKCTTCSSSSEDDDTDASYSHE